MALEKHLGDIVIAPGYVKSACDHDRVLNMKGKLNRVKEKGCYREMGNVFTVEERIPLLLIHGLLHLLGHDHESDIQWLLMTNRELEVLHEFRKAHISVED